MSWVISQKAKTGISYAAWKVIVYCVVGLFYCQAVINTVFNRLQ